MCQVGGKLALTLPPTVCLRMPRATLMPTLRWIGRAVPHDSPTDIQWRHMRESFGLLAAVALGFVGVARAVRWLVPTWGAEVRAPITAHSVCRFLAHWREGRGGKGNAIP